MRRLPSEGERFVGIKMPLKLPQRNSKERGDQREGKERWCASGPTTDRRRTMENEAGGRPKERIRRSQRRFDDRVEERGVLDKKRVRTCNATREKKREKSLRIGGK